tara:strand:- start:479 stop:1501 length:1023 start_codon:yes stop_codon:yes gene_type:complete
MALATHTPTTWNDILSTTMHNYHKTLTDNIFNSRPLLNYLMSNGRVKKTSGGISIVEPLIYVEGDADSYAEWDTVTVKPVNTATAAQFDWKQLYATIAISGLEEAQNNGKEMIVNLLEAKIMQAEDTLKTKLNGMLFGTTAGTTPANDFTSLITLVDDVATAGGIAPAGETWWKSIVTAVGAVDAAGLEAAMRTAYNSASDSGNDRVDSLFTDDAVFGFYESTLTPQVRYTDTAKANLGFQNLMFKNVPLFWDFQCPAGVMLGLNSKYVGLTIHSDRDFKQSPFTDNLSGSAASSGAAPGGPGIATANGLDARVSFITTYGNATIRNRRRCFKLTGISEA